MKFFYIILALMVLIILKPIYWIVSPSGPVNTKAIWLHYIGQIHHEVEEVNFKDIANFNWDYVYVFPPYYHSETSKFSDIMGELEMPQMLFFLNGNLVHTETYSFESDRFGLINPDLNLSENQLVFIDKNTVSESENKGNVNFVKNSKYSICTKNSRIAIYKTNVAKGRWPGRIFLAYTDGCIRSNLSKIID
ncbi:hypothetical protein [Methylobacillus sp. Pita1]|uniref:hypothetical protein n=1 Tax=Methylobacillus sp. Pita1 TaxID=3382642 RepID=UPI0038B56AA7